MRYDKDHKAETRKRVIEVAARRFRKNGIGATGVAELMADAGLTHGGFYGHFSSKEVLVQEAISAASVRGLQRLTTLATEARQAGRDPLKVILKDYLSVGHRDRADRGCCMAALGAELARHPKPTREMLTDCVLQTIDILAGLLPQQWAAERRQQRAAAIHAMMIGSLQLARGVHDPDKSERILEAGITGALALAQRSAD